MFHYRPIWDRLWVSPIPRLFPGSHLVWPPRAIGHPKYPSSTPSEASCRRRIHLDGWHAPVGLTTARYCNNSWTDWLESDRTQGKHQVRALAQFRIRGQGLTARYEWVHSRDDTDGPFSFPAQQSDIGGEWARRAEWQLII